MKSRKKREKRTQPAFTLIELLIVIAIIAILAAILFPVFAQAREQARTSVCVSNTRQIGLALGMYTQDSDESEPIFYAYNTVTLAGVSAKAGEPGHQGVEVLLLPYTKNIAIFQCPDDQGGPSLSGPALGCPGRATYYDCYGSSYRFDRGSYSTIEDVSTSNNAACNPSNPYCSTVGVVKLASFAAPAETRIMRDEMAPWFGPTDAAGKYGYFSTDPAANYFKQWHGRGMGIVFADGHSKFTVSASQFDNQVVCPAGGRSNETDPNATPANNPYGVYYGICD